jgi:hypothetical protein
MAGPATSHFVLASPDWNDGSAWLLTVIGGCAWLLIGSGFIVGFIVVLLRIAKLKGSLRREREIDQ